MGRVGSYANVLKYRLAVAKARKLDDPLRLAHTVWHLGDATETLEYLREVRAQIEN